ncbi:hypothetical protein MMC12_008633, partial [Toensbergia leucococca]|nr:hypothetical protein [Toensbergia leucococca]
NGHTTHIDFLSDLVPGDIDGIRRIANDWLEGRLGQLRVKGVAKVALKSGIFSLGTQSLSQSLLFEGQDLPAIPQYNITELNFVEVNLPSGGRGMAADVSLTLVNEYPVELTIPPLGFDILVPNCSPEEPYILLADAITNEIQIQPKTEVEVQVGGIIRELPEVFTTTCPNTQTSPLDLILGNYIRGEENTIYVRGSNAPSSDTPDWISDLIRSVVVPLPFPGHSFDNLIRNFSLADVHFGLPDPFADPNTPESQPRISAVVKALVGLPKEMNFPIDISRVRANADVYYRDNKLGILNLHEWQHANSTRIEAQDNEQPGLEVESVVKDAPLDVTDDDVFADLMRDLIFGGKGIVLGVQATVDVETETALGKFIVREIPAEGKVFVKPISGGNLAGFNPKVGALRVVDTTRESLTIEARINITNPTEYTARVPYVNINLLSNGSILGNATAENVSIVPGPNDNILVQALWNPRGKEDVAVGKELLSQYISGFNTTLTLQTHAGTIPSQPHLGRALSSLNLQIPTPKLHPPPNPNRDPNDDNDPNNNDDGPPRFIDDATMHLFTSTATFTLLSPLPSTTLYITHINATALYKTSPVGALHYDLPFAVPPGASQSPRLPVEWSLDSVGYEAVRKALGGELELEARAVVGIRIGGWEERVWFVGSGIGASVKI